MGRVIGLKILITGTVTTNEMRHDFKLFIQFSLMHILFQPYSYYSTVRVLTSTLRNLILGNIKFRTILYKMKREREFHDLIRKTVKRLKRHYAID